MQLSPRIVVDPVNFTVAGFILVFLLNSLGNAAKSMYILRFCSYYEDGDKLPLVID